MHRPFGSGNGRLKHRSIVAPDGFAPAPSSPIFEAGAVSIL
jgi:hypothetical protein